MTSFDYMLSHFGGKQRGDKNYFGPCPTCDSKDQLLWYTTPPHVFKCQKCGYTGNVYTIGFKDNNLERINGLSDMEKAVLQYRKNSGKHHRLKDSVISEFGLSLFQYMSSSEGRPYKAISLFKDEAPIKKLIVYGEKPRWIHSHKGNSKHLFLNAHSLAKNKNQQKIFIVAGEWDMFCFWEQFGIHALSPVNGESMSKKVPDKMLCELDIFSHKEVIIFGDNDPAGRGYASTLARAIARRVKTVSIKTPSMYNLGVMAGGDMDEFFELGGTRERLQEEVRGTAPIVFEKALEKSKNEIELPEREISRPIISDSIFPEKVSNIIWAVGKFSKNRRNQVFTQLAMDELGEEASKRDIADRIKEYSTELESMIFSSVNILIEKIFDRLKIKNAKLETSGPDSDVFLSYFYGDQESDKEKLKNCDFGVYNFFSSIHRTAIVETILEYILPPDNILNVGKFRFQIAQNVDVRLTTIPFYKFDSDKNIMNFRNGLYLVSEGILVPHNSKHLSTYQIQVDFDKDAKCPNFMKALSLWFSSQSDRDQFAVLMYYIISGIRTSEIIPYFIGQGRNGKTQALKLLTAIVGDERTSALPIENLSKSSQVDTLFGKWLNIVNEISDLKPGDVNGGVLKALAGESPLFADPKYKKPFKWINTAVFLVAANEMFKSTDTSFGFWRRLKFFQFSTISKEDLKINFFDQYLKPELSGIINYALTFGKKMWENSGSNFIKTQKDESFQGEVFTKNPTFGYWSKIMDHKKLNPDENRKEFKIFDQRSVKSEMIFYCDPHRHYEAFLEYCSDIGMKNKPGLTSFKENTKKWINIIFTENVSWQFDMSLYPMSLTKPGTIDISHTRKVIRIRKLIGQEQFDDNFDETEITFKISSM